VGSKAKKRAVYFQAFGFLENFLTKSITAIENSIYKKRQMLPEDIS
jgi:hypothetical protein